MGYVQWVGEVYRALQRVRYRLVLWVGKIESSTVGGWRIVGRVQWVRFNVQMGTDGRVKHSKVQWVGEV